MKIAIPVSNDKLCLHFGHCEQFRFFTIDEENKKVISTDNMSPPPHEPGVLPKWIGEQGANIILAGGMGNHAKKLLFEAGVKVITGVVQVDPNRAVEDYINDCLITGINSCDH